MLLITLPVTNLLLEPVASHSAVVLINRLGHCAQAEPCSLVFVCLSVMLCVCIFVAFMCAPHFLLSHPDFSLNPKHPRDIS